MQMRAITFYLSIPLWFFLSVGSVSLATTKAEPLLLSESDCNAKLFSMIAVGGKTALETRKEIVKSHFAPGGLFAEDAITRATADFFSAEHKEDADKVSDLLNSLESTFSIAHINTEDAAEMKMLVEKMNAVTQKYKISPEKYVELAKRIKEFNSSPDRKIVEETLADTFQKFKDHALSKGDSLNANDVPYYKRFVDGIWSRRFALPFEFSAAGALFYSAFYFVAGNVYNDMHQHMPPIWWAAPYLLPTALHFGANAIHEAKRGLLGPYLARIKEKRLLDSFDTGTSAATSETLNLLSGASDKLVLDTQKELGDGTPFSAEREAYNRYFTKGNLGTLLPLKDLSIQEYLKKHENEILFPLETEAVPEAQFRNAHKIADAATKLGLKPEEFLRLRQQFSEINNSVAIQAAIVPIVNNGAHQNFDQIHHDFMGLQKLSAGAPPKSHTVNLEPSFAPFYRAQFESADSVNALTSKMLAFAKDVARVFEDIKDKDWLLPLQKAVSKKIKSIKSQARAADSESLSTEMSQVLNTIEILKSRVEQVDQSTQALSEKAESLKIAPEEVADIEHMEHMKIGIKVLQSSLTRSAQSLSKLRRQLLSNSSLTFISSLSSDSEATLKTSLLELEKTLQTWGARK